METTCKQKTEVITNKPARGYVSWCEILTLEQNQDTPVDIGNNLKIFEFFPPPVFIGSGSTVKALSGGLSPTSINSGCPAVFVRAGLLGAFALKQTQ